jgi:hypothetical protein
MKYRTDVRCGLCKYIKCIHSEYKANIKKANCEGVDDIELRTLG